MELVKVGEHLGMKRRSRRRCFCARSRDGALTGTGFDVPLAELFGDELVVFGARLGGRGERLGAALAFRADPAVANRERLLFERDLPELVRGAVGELEAPHGGMAARTPAMRQAVTAMLNALAYARTMRVTRLLRCVFLLVGLAPASCGPSSACTDFANQICQEAAKDGLTRPCGPPALPKFQVACAHMEEECGKDDPGASCDPGGVAD